MCVSNGNCTVSKSLAWQVLCYELYGQRALPTAKTSEVASIAFSEKAAIFATNCSATIHYGLILPLIEKAGGLDENDKVYLDVYRKHTALCSEVQKVQKAYQSYSAAREAADKAKAPFESFEARKQAFAAGNDLVTKYDALVDLAIRQAEEIYLDVTAHKAGVLGKLEEETPGLIYHTVNMIRSQKNIESFLLKPENFFKNDPSFQENLSLNYLSSVKSFVLNVQEASLKSGNISVGDQSVDITNAFVKGLAAISDLGEGLNIIKFYKMLNDQQAPVEITKTQNGAIQHFQSQIEVLMNQPQEITTADLEKIQYQGIPLSSVLKSISADQLNALKHLRSELQGVEGEIEENNEANTQIVQKQLELIEESARYSFADVQEFLDSLLEEKEGATLENLPKGKLCDLANECNSARKTEGDIKARKKVLETKKEEASVAKKEEIARKQEEIVGKEKEIKDLVQASALKVLEHIDAKKELAKFTKDFELKKRTPVDVNVSKTMKKKWDDHIQECADEQKQQTEKLTTLAAECKENAEKIEAQKAILQELENGKDALISEAKKKDAEYVGQIKALEEHLLGLQGKKMAALTGQDVKDLAEHFEVKSLAGDSENPITVKLNRIHAAETRINELTNVILPELHNRVKALSARMTNVSTFLTLNDKQAFVLDAAMFGDKEKVAIADQLTSNLVIAQKVTMAVGRKIVERRDAFYTAFDQKFSQKIGVSLSEGEALKDRVSGLGSDLDLLEIEFGKEFTNADDLDSLVKTGLEKLSPQVLLDDDSDVELLIDSSGEEIDEAVMPETNVLVIRSDDEV